MDGKRLGLFAGWVLVVVVAKERVVAGARGGLWFVKPNLELLHL